jgi:hypothetical protein
MNRHFTAIIEREDDLYVALCPELDISSQGETVSEARNTTCANLSNCSWNQLLRTKSSKNQDTVNSQDNRDT